jgi:hypothetical protein
MMSSLACVHLRPGYSDSLHVSFATSKTASNKFLRKFSGASGRLLGCSRLPEPISISLAIAALVVSIVSAIATYRIASRQNALQEQMLAVETARERERRREAQSAQVTVSIERSGREHRLRVGNGGNATVGMFSLADGKRFRA